MRSGMVRVGSAVHVADAARLAVLVLPGAILGLLLRYPVPVPRPTTPAPEHLSAKA